MLIAAEIFFRENWENPLLKKVSSLLFIFRVFWKEKRLLCVNPGLSYLKLYFVLNEGLLTMIFPKRSRFDHYLLL